ncbi:hypothetical protein GS597_04290 [Synechococcales cyanobacterium C]|uniref:Uncharacterized protein n=1 Tax=Petrachloros mirabilis ULC683 TaxID=2781853 RepID=A0A8K1ZX70_9CYAN|nr:hypothetical protein [Petrachloros mirabilis]NCJ05742.1 hypothetical protein [Petrachloros mirabilis ULC683]
MEMLQLAQQGNLKALSVLLNRELVVKGAHAKLQQKDHCLKILVQSPQTDGQLSLVQLVRQTLLNLKPITLQTVQIYFQQLGTPRAGLVQEFHLLSSKSTAPEASAPSSQRAYPGTKPQRQKAAFRQHPPSKPQPQEQSPSAQHLVERLSVAEFLAQATTLEDLQVLKGHPFFTGKCPQCGHSFNITNQTPIYWDCHHCDWKDDLSALVPTVKPSASSTQPTLSEIKKLGNYLVEAGLLTEAQIGVALADQEMTGMRLGDILVRRGWVKEETIEYLMKKVILPERQASQSQSASYLNSSRNLLRALLNQPSLEEHPGMQPALEQSQPVETPTPSPIEPTHAEAKPAPKPRPMVANDRATLILPDMDLDDYLEGFRD